MKLIIDLPEEDFGWNGILNICRCSFERLIQIVSEGTPLEEYCDNHISRDKAIVQLSHLQSDWDDDWNVAIRKCIENVKIVPPVIAEKIEHNESAQVELEGDGYADGELVYDFGKCPNCGWEFEEGDKDWEQPYCCHCGQKLHWFEEQEVKG